MILPSGTTERLVHGLWTWSVHRRINMLSGRPVLTRSRASEAGECDRAGSRTLVALVQTDSEIGEIIIAGIHYPQSGS